MNKHIWEGWTAQDFVDELAPPKMLYQVLKEEYEKAKQYILNELQ